MTRQALFRRLKKCAPGKTVARSTMKSSVLRTGPTQVLHTSAQPCKKLRPCLQRWEDLDADHDISIR